MRTDLSALIQRKQDTEQRLGIKLEALYAYREEAWIHVNGEVHALNSGALERSIYIVINLYDSTGRLIESLSEYIDSEEFFGFDSFSTLANLANDHQSVTRILVFVKAG